MLHLLFYTDLEISRPTHICPFANSWTKLDEN